MLLSTEIEVQNLGFFMYILKCHLLSKLWKNSAVLQDAVMPSTHSSLCKYRSLVVTFEQRAAFPHHDGTGCSILAQTQLHEEERHAREKEHDEVRDEKHTCRDHKHAGMRKE